MNKEGLITKSGENQGTTVFGMPFMLRQFFIVEYQERGIEVH
jgi:hypothetical protein